MSKTTVNSAEPTLLSRIVSVLLMGLVIGSLSSLAAITFVEGITWANKHLLISLSTRGSVDPTLMFWATLLVPAIGGLAVGLLLQLSTDKRPHNPSDVIQMVQCRFAQPMLTFKNNVITVLAAFMSLACGASVGIYGPLVHLGSVIGLVFRRLRYTDIAVVTGCGVAAAISTVFSAPLAGILFAHEVIIRHYSLRAFAPITIASSTGFYLTHFVFEREPLFEIPLARIAYIHEFFAFIVIGIGGALVAVVFMRTFLKFGEWAQKTPIPAPTKPMLAGLCLGLLALQTPEILGSGVEALRFILTPDSYQAPDLLWLLAAKLIATSLCLGFGFAGGIFSPSLMIGMAFGSLLGLGAEWLFPAQHSVIALYAICGMAAVTSPVIGAPLSTILIVFELTRNYELATAVMISVVFANVVAYRLFGHSIFDHQVKMRGYDLSRGRVQITLDNQTIESLIQTDYTRIESTETLYVARKKMVKNAQTEAHVVTEAGDYFGSLNINTILRLEDSLDIRVEKAALHAGPASLIFCADDSVWQAMEAMSSFVGESIPVVSDTNALLGVVPESSLISAYIDNVESLRKEEHATP